MLLDESHVVGVRILTIVFAVRIPIVCKVPIFLHKCPCFRGFAEAIGSLLWPKKVASMVAHLDLDMETPSFSLEIRTLKFAG